MTSTENERREKLARDPDELRDPASERRDLAEETAAGLSDRTLPDLSPKDVERFRALGYVQ